MNFTSCLGFTLGCEGGFTVNPRDRGNWTGGEIGVGKFNGTNFGLSAAAYPHPESARPHATGGGCDLSARLLAADPR